VRHLACFLFPFIIASVLSAQSEKPIEPQKYELGPDSNPVAGVPEGKVTRHTWKSQVFEGTVRDYYLYVPAQYDAAKPTAVMVFQDGHAYVNKTGEYRVPVVFDNLIHKQEIPPIIGIFVDPGHRGDPLPESRWRANNRSFEYDTLSDQYSKLILDEILPEVARSFHLTNDPKQRAIGGASSGGICAWTVAWERPDAFRKVLSHIGSFTNIRGGHNYQAMIRKTARKPIRVLLQDGDRDLNNEHGNWWLANLEMESSLQFAKYDVKTVWGHGGHSGSHGGATLPDSLRWLWRAEEAPYKFDDEIKAFEAADQLKTPPTGAILFAGASSIRLWSTLAQDFPQRTLFNRGFGGSMLSDNTFFADQIVIPYKPKLILIQAGGNDINNGKSPEQVLVDFKAYVAKVRGKLPETRILYMGINPSPARWGQAEKQKAANRLIKEFCQQGTNLGFIDQFDAMLGPDGKPRPELYVEDQLHPSEAGYQLRTRLITPHLNP
jgi:enterochelin esterase family protein